MAKALQGIGSVGLNIVVNVFLRDGLKRLDVRASL